PDPFRRHELRYWNGRVWTEHVATHGRQSVDPPVHAPAPVAGRIDKRARRDALRAGVAVDGATGGGTLLTEPVLVVSQKAKLVEVNAEYAIHDQHGRRLGAVRQVGNNLMKKAVGADQNGSKRLQIVDADGALVMTLTRPVSLL